jgi:hypothetical protein
MNELTLRVRRRQTNQRKGRRNRADTRGTDYKSAPASASSAQPNVNFRLFVRLLHMASLIKASLERT